MLERLCPHLWPGNIQWLIWIPVSEVHVSTWTMFFCKPQYLYFNLLINVIWKIVHDPTWCSAFWAISYISEQCSQWKRLQQVSRTLRKCFEIVYIINNNWTAQLNDIFRQMENCIIIYKRGRNKEVSVATTWTVQHMELVIKGKRE